MKSTPAELEYGRQWYAKNRERRIAQTIAYRRRRYAIDPEYRARCDAHTKAFYLRNPDKQKFKTQRYMTEHPGKSAEYRHRRTFRLKATQHLPSFTDSDWVSLKALYGNLCLMCHCPEAEKPLTVDHRVPVALGGSNSVDNIQPLCLGCNAKKYLKVMFPVTFVQTRKLGLVEGPAELQAQDRMHGRPFGTPRPFSDSSL